MWNNHLRTAEFQRTEEPSRRMIKTSYNKAAGESKPEAYPLGYVEDFDEPRTRLDGVFIILLWRSAIFGCDPISHQRRRIDLLQHKIGMPNKLAFKPLTRHALIS